MSKPCIAYLIDPYVLQNGVFTATPFREIQYDGDYKSLYKWLSTPYYSVSAFDAVRLDRGDTIYVDDEGLLNNPTHFFHLDGYPNPLAGRGVVLGTDDEGDSVSPRITLAALIEMVGFSEIR